MGIDRDRSLNDLFMLSKRFCFVLEPIGGCANVKGQKVWEAAFIWVVKNWETYEDLSLYKNKIEKVPQLTFVIDDNDKAFIFAEGDSLQHLVNCISVITPKN